MQQEQFGRHTPGFLIENKVESEIHKAFGLMACKVETQCTGCECSEKSTCGEKHWLMMSEKVDEVKESTLHTPGQGKHFLCFHRHYNSMSTVSPIFKS